VVCRSDPAGGKHVVVRSRVGPNFSCDDVEFIGDDGNLPDINAKISEFANEKQSILVLRLARQNLVSDNNDAGTLCHVWLNIPCGKVAPGGAFPAAPLSEKASRRFEFANISFEVPTVPDGLSYAS